MTPPGRQLRCRSRLRHDRVASGTGIALQGTIEGVLRLSGLPRSP